MTLRYSSDFFILLLGRFLQVLISIASIRLSTTLLPEDELGLVYYIVAIQTFFALFFINPVGQFFNRRTNRWSLDGTIFQYFIKQGFYIFSISILSLCVLSLLNSFEVLKLSFFSIAIIAALIMVQSLNQTVVPLLNMLGRRRAFVFFNLVNSILCVFCSIIFVHYFESNAFYWFLGILVGTVIINCFAIIFLKQITNSYASKQSQHIDLKSSYLPLLSFVLPISFSTIFLWFLASGYRLLIEDFYGLEFLALIGVGLAVASQIFTTVEALLTQFYLPILYKNIESVDIAKRKIEYDNYLKSVVPIFISIAIFLTFSIKFIFPLLVADKYHSFYVYAIYGVWVELFRVLTNVLSTASQIERRTSSTIVPYLAGATILFVGLFFFSEEGYKRFFMDLLLVAYALVFLSMAVFMRSLLRYTFPIKDILQTIFFVVPSILFFCFVNFTTELNTASEIFTYTSIGCVLFSAGIILRIGKLIND